MNLGTWTDKLSWEGNELIPDIIWYNTICNRSGGGDNSDILHGWGEVGKKGYVYEW